MENMEKSNDTPRGKKSIENLLIIVLIITAGFIGFKLFSARRVKEVTKPEVMPVKEALSPVLEERKVTGFYGPIEVEIKDNWFCLNGEKIFIKGMGYGAWRPNQLPWLHRINPDIMEKDFELIRSAGFNAIRTWAPLTRSELDLARKYGLLVIMGIWFDPTRDYGSPAAQNYALNMALHDIKNVQSFDNIMIFLISNEPPVERVLISGKETTESMFAKMVEKIHELEKNRYISFSNWPQLAFLGLDYLDAVCFNVFSYNPVTVSHCLGYRPYVEWLKQKHARNKPLVISEFGLSVSPVAHASIERYGGLSDEEQAEGMLEMYDDLVQAGATGGCVFAWVDEWWKNDDFSGDETKHDKNDPEEWFGVLAIPDESSNITGTPRLLYKALKDYNQAIMIEPKKMDYYRAEVPIEVFVTEWASLVEYQVDKTKWQPLEKEGRLWWKGSWDSSRVKDGEHILRIRAFEIKSEETGEEEKILLVEKEAQIWTFNKTRIPPPPISVKVIPDEPKYFVGHKTIDAVVKVRVTDADGNPVCRQRVDYGIFESSYWEQVKGSKVTDEKGEIEFRYLLKEPGFISFSAGSTYQKGNYQRRFGDIVYVEVVKKK